MQARVAGRTLTCNSVFKFCTCKLRARVCPRCNKCWSCICKLKARACPRCNKCWSFMYTRFSKTVAAHRKSACHGHGPRLFCLLCQARLVSVFVQLWRASAKGEIQHLGRQVINWLKLLQPALDRLLVLFVLGSASQSPLRCLWVGVLNPNRTPPLG